MLGRLLRLFVVLAPIAVSVGFVAVASRVVRRPEQWYGLVCWWVGLTLAATLVLLATERVLRRALPLVALFRLSLVFPDHAPSRFKVAMRTNTLRQLQRSLEAGELDQADFQEAAERLVALAGALNAHDRMTRGHTERVRAYTLMIGEELHLPKDDLDRLHWAGLVHDIGKLEVPPSILNKQGRPDDDEWAILKGHPAAAIPMLDPLRPWLGEWADAASQHHERWDGEGYPLGLAGEAISLSGRIVAVADAFDVMTSVRSYKKAMTPEAAREELARCAGTQFDPNVVRAFLNISVGKLRLVMGPLSWLAQAPVLGNIPLGAGAATVASSFVAVGVAITAGLTGGLDRAPPQQPVVILADSPVAQPITIRGPEDLPVTLDWPTTAGDPPSSITVTAVPDHLRLDAASPLVLIPERNWFGRSVGEYQACWDDRCSTARLDVELQPVNDTPSPSPDGASTPEGTPVSIDVLANDIDIEDGRPVLTSVGLDSSTTGGGATMTPDSRVLFQPADGFVGTVRLTYTVADSVGAEAQATVTIEVTTVDTPPRALDDMVTTRAGTTEVIDVLANDTDDENEPLTIVSVTPPTVGEVVLTANGVTFTSPPASAETSFSYTIEDGSGGRGQATVYVTVVTADPSPTAAPAAAPTTTPPAPTPPTAPPTTAPVAPANPSPTARSDQMTLVEDSPSIDVDVLANDTSADGDLSNDTLGIAAAPTQGTAQIVGQQLRYQPFPDANGVDNVTYEVCETTGKCDSATVTLTITPLNDPPRFLDAGAIAVGEDSGPISISSWASSISAGASNESAQNVGFTVTVDQPTMFSTLPALDRAGTLTFTPAPHANGATTITVTAIDDGGTSNGGNNTSTTRTATITINAVNDPVIAVDDSATIAEDDAVGATIDVLANDTDADNDPLSIFSIDTSGVVGGTVTNLGAGSINYTPEPEFNGTERFTYIVSDSNGSTDTATVTITVNAIRTRPSQPPMRTRPPKTSRSSSLHPDSSATTTTMTATPSASPWRP